MTKAFISDSWNLRERLRTARRAYQNPVAARAMLDAYDNGAACITVNAMTRSLGDELTVVVRPGMMSVALELPPILHVDIKRL